MRTGWLPWATHGGITFDLARERAQRVRAQKRVRDLERVVLKAAARAPNVRGMLDELSKAICPTCDGAGSVDGTRPPMTFVPCSACRGSGVAPL